MPQTHALKILPEFFSEVLAGRKKSEIRCTSDRDFRVGDMIVLWEWDPKRKKYTRRAVSAQITSIQQLVDVFELYRKAGEADAALTRALKLVNEKMPMVVIGFATRNILVNPVPPVE